MQFDFFNLCPLPLNHVTLNLFVEIILTCPYLTAELWSGAHWISETNELDKIRFGSIVQSYVPSTDLSDLNRSRTQTTWESKSIKPRHLTLIGKSWKTHSENFPKFQFSGVWHRRISGKLIQYFFEISILGLWAGQLSDEFSSKLKFRQIFCINYPGFAYKG